VPHVLAQDDALALLLLREGADDAPTPVPVDDGEDALAALVARARDRIDAEPALRRLWGARAWLSLRRPGPWLLPVLAVLGAATTGLAGDGRLNVLTPPLLGLVLWQWLTFALLAGRRATGAGDGLLRGALARLAGRVPALGGDGATTAAVARAWGVMAAPVLRARVAATLHAGAAALAAGAVAGLYLDGLGVAYRATWESTFLGAGAVETLLAVVLGPAAAVTGLGLPDAAGIAAMAQAPVPAAPWIHLWAATLALWAVLPRVALATLALRGADAPVTWPDDDPWLERRLAAGSGRGVHLRAQPVGYRPAVATWEALQARADADWGAGARIERNDPLPWDVEADDVARGSADRLLVLFSPVQVPETDVHGPLLDALEAGGPVTVVLDASGWDAAPERRRARLDAWRRLLDARPTAHLTL
jgi:hypothetical protein